MARASVCSENEMNIPDRYHQRSCSRAILPHPTSSTFLSKPANPLADLLPNLIRGTITSHVSPKSPVRITKKPSLCEPVDRGKPERAAVSLKTSE
ncbi:uncharacterized protein L969DRAFT_53336 [Mixia osmundae IAM 14324]|uniref:Uncharacterized protein n=1 Tax=Mixia osmundae (strain CBS 9802 / IAM 14324 / JCM 22182 / KY 12970) TaxID=764103 RepID=G7DUQ9_MIXOS|nr:uncharacterized protein L969DRAFT_53336 [Mixia osmundae IAM 14324]KEI37465.1 hypothetical protein L969DRAFT_53336 [Mixia osmundae IAM 14324]GAA94319.1 hypothetical protein E5Q_00969 [Mixia osmundae IAM 14324]